MKDIFKSLSDKFYIKQMKSYIQVKLPLVLWTSGSLLNLKIKRKKEGYTIYCSTNLFLEANAGGDQTYYFNIFEKYDKNYHFDIKIKNGVIYKDYSKESSPTVAINEFIRFYIMLDDFIINNGVIGSEEKFQ